MPKEILDEVKSTGDESETLDPKTPEGGTPKGKNRPADQSISVDPKADEIEDDVKTPQGKDKAMKAPKRHADKGEVKEAVNEMFAGDDLSEEFKDKATVVFEAAVNATIEEAITDLEEQFEVRLDEQVDLAVSELTESVGKYLDALSTKWLEENSLAVDRGIKSEMAESLMSGLRDLFSEHNIDVSDETVDVVEELTQELDEVKEKLNTSMNESIDLKKQLAESAKDDILAEISEGLTEIQADKLKTLSEGVEFDDVDTFKEKVAIIKENYFPTESTKTETLNEEIEAEDHSRIDPQMAVYMSAISRNIEK